MAVQSNGAEPSSCGDRKLVLHLQPFRHQESGLVSEKISTVKIKNFSKELLLGRDSWTS